MFESELEELQAALRRLHPGVQPVRIDGMGYSRIQWLEAWPVESPRHWHIVSFGLSELGQELTLRLPRQEESEPPLRALALMDELAGDLVERREDAARGFAVGESFAVSAGFDNLCGVVISEDPSLGWVATASGGLELRQVVGIREQELEADGTSLLAALRARDPLLMTRPGRALVGWRGPLPPMPPKRQSGESEVVWAWRRIEWWLERQKRGLSNALAPGATASQIEIAERKLGIQLPPEVRESYLRHDGMRDDLFGAWRLMPLEEMLKEWAFDRYTYTAPETHGPVKALPWSPRWIPVMSDGAGNFLCMDLDPPAMGRLGQLIEVSHDPYGRFFIAEGFTPWLLRFADEFEAGKYEYTPDEGIVHVDNW